MKSPQSRRFALIAAVLLCCCTGSAHAGFSGPPPGGDPGGPVTRTVTLLPTLAETRMHATAESLPGDSCRAGDVAPQAPLRVGFYEWFVENGPLFCRKANVYQSALYFDLAEIAVAPRVVITEAVLHAGEDLLSAHGANAPLVGG